MSEINIRTLFPFKRVKITEIKSSDDGKLTLVKLEPDNRCLPICSGCRHPAHRVHSMKTRMLNDLPMSGSKVIVYYKYRTVWCPRCCAFRVEHHDFVEPYARATNRFVHYIHALCKLMTVTNVAAHTQLSWDQVSRIDRIELKKRYSEMPKKHLSILCIDEISMKKRHNYLTVIADHQTGRVLDVLESRTFETVSLFLKNLPKSVRNEIKAVAMDMWDPYIKAFKKWCPEACIVFDPFHVIAAFNKVIDQIRAEQYRKAGARRKNLMKQCRFLLLKNPENLKKEQRPKLKAILEENALLAQVYLLKEYLKRLWQYKYPKAAENFLNYWCELAEQTESELLIKFTKMLKRHAYGILNHCRFPISNARLEGINNKIKVIKRMAYGYRDLEYFKLKIIQATAN